MTDPNLLAGRYRLLERRDRAGTTWRSRDELLQRDVTITGIPLPPPGPHRDGLLGRIRAAADFRHPNVIALHDVVSLPDRVWLILESVEGRSVLQTVRAEGPLTSERTAEVGLRVLDAQTSAHERGVRLLAGPESVLLTPDGRVVVTGFAIFDATDELRDLGAVLFTAVEGQAPGTGPHTGPYTGPHPAGGTAPTPGTVGGSGPASGGTGAAGSGPLAPLLEGLLATDPARRPDAATARTILRGLTPRPAGSRRRTRLLVMAAALVLLAGGGTAFWLLWPRPAVQPRDTAPAPLPTFFAKAPDPCSLISGEQADRLYLAPSPSREKTACEWPAADRTAPGSLKNTLEITVVREPKAALAHSAYLRLRSRDAKDSRIVNAPADVPGLGDEAYVYQLGNGHSSVNSVVVFRTGNLVTALQYHRFTVTDTGGRGRAGALQAARWVIDALRGRR
ncbi:hypothetical protein GCM10022252_35990 [Streptosporangium oxazolinicum]|uniref:Protein kinase domain-containing protein n=1 Tax=Streptosporangium oxazolinicum TaxID=909287 RepID=A0ABP8AYK4_9ACTN